jgi:hypothetical protein
MGQKIVVGPIDKGIRTDRLPFVIDNDSFPVLLNAYQWRGRVKRKRGTTPLVHLSRYFNSTSTAYNSGSTTITFNGSGVANLLTGFSLQTNAAIIPGSVTITASVGPTVYTDPTQDGFLTPTGTGGLNTINYASGAIVIPAQAGGTATAVFRYYPNLPVLGLEDLSLDPTTFAKTLGFDNKYAYNITNNKPYLVYDVSFYKNPSITGKVTWTPTSWNGADYNQFWSVNYQGALWVTNGVDIPFSGAGTTIGMQFLPSGGISSATRASATTVDFVIPSTPLVIGDYVYANEFTGTSGRTLNFQTGYVSAIAGTTYTVTFPNANIGAAGLTPGILQYLTNRSNVNKDCIRWYDGDPTNGNSVTPGFVNGKGWVNFMPPVSQSPFTIADTPARQYYLVGCRMIFPFKDRLLFIGPVIQASTGNPIYLQDTVIYSQNGTPYYTCSFDGTATNAATSVTTSFTPILVPENQTATAPAYFSDSTGFGGFVTAGIQQDINTAASNQDVIIMGFDNTQTRFVYTGDDILPFAFYLINSEYGSSSTFSAINMDEGVLTRGDKGYVMTTQTSCGRFDLDIPDDVFQVRLKDNGVERFCAQRDFINEWIYFTFPSNNVNYKYPNQTLQYNYRDKSWATFYESYTTYGQFRKSDALTWATLQPDLTWESWNTPWNSGQTTVFQPDVIAGNQQGFVVFRDDGTTNETNSLFIKQISGSVVTSPGHCLRGGEFIIISGCLGTIGAVVNDNIYSVKQIDSDTFELNPPISSGTYLGGGLIKKMYVPQIQTKQFPVGWGDARKTRIGVQQYLLTKTTNAQIQLLIYLSQNSSNPYNAGPIVPDTSSINQGLIYSTVLYTCPESTNLGLTPANVNLQMVTGEAQGQIWHRINTSLIGDTIQFGFTLSEEQMRDTDFKSQFAEIELHGFIIDVSPSMVLS